MIINNIAKLIFSLLLIINFFLFPIQIYAACYINGSVQDGYSQSECEKFSGTWDTSADYPSSNFIPNADTSSISSYIKSIYTYAIGVVGIVATVVIMINGLIWITSMGNASRISYAKDWIAAALTGLALALFSYAILYIVNPDLVNLKPLNLDTTVAIADGQATTKECLECRPISGVAGTGHLTQDLATKIEDAYQSSDPWKVSGTYGSELGEKHSCLNYGTCAVIEIKDEYTKDVQSTHNTIEYTYSDLTSSGASVSVVGCDPYLSTALKDKCIGSEQLDTPYIIVQ